MVEVALFPIPNVVAFPGFTLPLHVFEPRYRQLVHDCVDANRLLGVCHVTKTIREAPKHQTVEDALKSNQATYQPQTVFTAGACEIIEELEDGRILAEVDMQQRLALDEEIQSLPYRIVTCSPLMDLPETVSHDENEALKVQIHNKLIALVQTQDGTLATSLNEPIWQNMTPYEYSFLVFQILRLDADFMQRVLELRTTHERLDLILSILNADSQTP